MPPGVCRRSRICCTRTLNALGGRLGFVWRCLKSTGNATLPKAPPQLKLDSQWRKDRRLNLTYARNNSSQSPKRQVGAHQLLAVGHPTADQQRVGAQGRDVKTSVGLLSGVGDQPIKILDFQGQQKVKQAILDMLNFTVLTTYRCDPCSVREGGLYVSKNVLPGRF